MAKITKSQARAELARRRAGAKKSWNPLSALSGPDGTLYQDQVDVLLSLQAGFDSTLEGTRQLGKTRLACVAGITFGLAVPRSEVAYVDLDILHAEKVGLREIENILEQYDIPAKLINGELHFDNGSVMYVFSGRPSEVEKLQGLKFSLLIVDEAQDGSDVGGILKMCRPALIRWGGRVLLMGIPGHVKGFGFWYDITEGDKKHTFKQHRGSMWNNPYLSHESIREQMEKAKAELGEDSPDFQRHWLGIWPDADNASRVYRWNPLIHTYEGPPPICQYYASGTDPAGVRDREVTVVIGWNDNDDRIWVIAENVSKKGEGGDYCATAEVLKTFKKSFPNMRAWYDFGSAAKSMLVTTMTQDFAMYVEAVPPKSLDFEIPRVNGLFKSGRLLVNKAVTPELAADLANALWNLEAKAKGQNKYSTLGPHPDCADALRASLWGVPGFARDPKAKAPKKTEVEVALEAVEAMYKKPVDANGTPTRYGLKSRHSTRPSANQRQRRY